MNPDKLAPSSPIREQIRAHLPAWVVALPGTQPTLFTLIRIAVLLGTFLVIEKLIVRCTRLGPEIYAAPSIAVELLLNFGLTSLIVLGVGVIFALRGGPWDELEFGRAMRWFVAVLALAIAWPLVSFPYNYYFDQAYNLDRILLSILVGLIWLRPIFVFPFLILAYAVLWQFGTPSIGGSIFAHKLQILHVLNLFAAMFSLHMLTGSRRADDFWFLCCCLIAGSYWVAASAKMDLSWLSHGGLQYILPAAYAHGWLAGFSPETVATIAKTIAPFDTVMRTFVLFVEGACLVFLWRLRWSIGLLAGVVVFHCAVFAFYGFLFWTWIVVDLALLIFLVRHRSAIRKLIYTPAHFIASIVVIALATWWAKPPQLGWIDTRLNYTYQIEAIDTNGEKFTLSPGYFGPYEDVVTMSPFRYLSSESRLDLGPYGVTKSIKVADALEQAQSAEDVYELEATLGSVRFNAMRYEKFRQFVVQYVTNKNHSGAVDPIPGWIRAPRQMWSTRHVEYSDRLANIAEIVVREHTSLFDGSRISTIRINELMRISTNSTDSS